MIFYFSSRCNQWWNSWKNTNDVVETLRYFASQVICLRIDQCFSSDVLNKINIIDYSYVRILKLCQLNATQLDAIRAHNFPHLEHLCPVKTHNFSLEILCQFKSLHSCEMQSLDIDTKDSNFSSSSIQSMFLRQCYPRDMPILLRHFPQMIFFKVLTYVSNDFVDKSNPIVNIVHPNLESFDIHVVDIGSSMDETSNDKYNLVSELLTAISFDKPIRYILTLVDTMNFDFEQFQHTVRKLDFVRLSCRLMWLHKYRASPNIDCIRQIPLFNQLKTLYTNSKATFCRTVWNKTSISNY